jgi:hypothetical protein
MTDEHNSYNWISKRLIEDPNDVVGALAYALYKRQKIAYIKAYTDEHDGVEPDDAALKSFHIATDTDTFEASIRSQAEVMLDKFLDQVLAGQLDEMEKALKESVFVSTSKAVEASLRQNIDSSKDLINSEISKVITLLSDRKGLLGWGRDLATNFLVNMLTVIVIGVIAVGVAKMDAISAYIKQAIENAANSKTP